MAIGNPTPDTAAQAATGDPLVQYLVVRRERPAPLDALVSAAARAVVLANERFAGDPAHAELTARWKAESYRKVTLRASERDWAKMLERHEAALAMDDAGEPLIAALPVRARSTLCRAMRDLQAYGPDTSSLPHRLPPLPAEPFMLIVPNPHAPMSGGKLLAQVGHAALMAADLPAEWAAGRVRADDGLPLEDGEIARWRDALTAWSSAGLSILPAFVDLGTFTRLATRSDAVVVTDSGLTEVAPGTRTVLAVRPVAGDDALALRGVVTRA